MGETIFECILKGGFLDEQVSIGNRASFGYAVVRAWVYILNQIPRWLPTT
jgi:hypothetical protein